MSQPLAYLDPAFLESEEARPLRILAEYLEPLGRFKAQNIQDTVVFFGSARIHSREAAEQALERLERRAGRRADGRTRSASRPRPQGGRVVALLRGSARAGRAADDLVAVARIDTPPLRRHVRRRPGHHGGGQPRRP